MVVGLTASGFAQTAEVTAEPLTDRDIQLLRSEAQADKNKIIADTMQFSDAEAQKFWPLYRDYAREQRSLAEQRGEIIRQYGEQYTSMSDATADDQTRRMLELETKFVALRKSYWPQFVQAIGARRAAKFYQLDNRLNLIVNLQLAEHIPILP